ncbi:hypothetical protein BDB00DRAFT_829813 [Zychaea mexicana]|uniref:uncharacterized protein n=1 Tax=Zychaea mexicana TaxID=64656 RepID=UPI0022FDBF38|nr:uncharacterized protein BDB00DRAFT_829813 [Zychaea mexicana]KAI9492029.1 hypothetical protein BDB00DRAFT_829813 [Zychaea mexicana]
MILTTIKMSQPTTGTNILRNKQHRKQQLSSDQYCAQCKKSFTRRRDRSRHENSVHLRQERFQCSLCTKTFTRKDSRVRHENQCNKAAFHLSSSPSGSPSFSAAGIKNKQEHHHPSPPLSIGGQKPLHVSTDNHCCNDRSSSSISNKDDVKERIKLPPIQQKMESMATMMDIDDYDRNSSSNSTEGNIFTYKTAATTTPSNMSPPIGDDSPPMSIKSSSL